MQGVSATIIFVGFISDESVFRLFQHGLPELGRAFSRKELKRGFLLPLVLW